MADPCELFLSIMKGVVEDEESPKQPCGSESLFSDPDEDEEEDEGVTEEDDGDGEEDYGDGEEDDEDGEKDEGDGEEDEEFTEGSSSMVKKTTSSDRNRIRRQCVICGKRLLYLAHHLKRQHKVLQTGRRMRLLYQARQIDPIKRSKVAKYDRKTRDCIFPGCHAKALNRLDNHLVAVHKLKRGSVVFAQILTSTRVGRSQPDEMKKENYPKKEIDGRSSVFDRAGEHLLLLAGGGTSAKKTVRNHVLQMARMSKLAGGVTTLFNNSTRLRHIIATLQKNKAPKTIMKYLESIKKLGTYMMIEEEEAILLGIQQSKLAKTERLASALIKGLRPLAKKRESQLKAQIRDKLIDASDVRKFCDMMKKETATHITRLSNGENIHWPELLLIRNYLITELLVAGAPRSGVITKFTLGQFNKSTKLTREDGSMYWVANVDEHKTASSHGPARLVFSSEAYELAKVYADHGRVQTANVDVKAIMQAESPFFLENKGKEVTRVAQTVFRLWKSHGFDGSLNPTHLRYTAATKACENLNTLSKRGVANLMAHTEATQEHYYNALQADNAAVDASLLVRKSICQQTSKSCALQNSETPMETTCEVEEAVAEKSSFPRKKRRVFSSNVEEYIRDKLKAKLKESGKKRKTPLKDIS